MRLTTIILFILFPFCLKLSAQGDLLSTGQKIFTLKNAKLSLGLGFDWWGGKPVPNITGKIPDGYYISLDTSSHPVYTYSSLFVDVVAPNSRISFTTGIQWNSFNFQIEHESYPDTNTLKIKQIQVPFFIKFRTGKKFSKFNIFFFGGGSYNIPVSYSNRGKSKALKTVQNNYSWMSGIGIQYNYRGLTIDPNDPKYRYTKKPKVSLQRVWLFVKSTGNLTNLFNTGFEENILHYSNNEEMDYRDFRFTLGLAIFFGSVNRYQVK